MNEIAYLNGKLIPISEARISILDYGFLYGYGLYETIRAYNDKPFRLDSHLARLRFSGNRLGIMIHTALLRDAVNEVIAANKFDQARIRITVSAGEGTMTPNVFSCDQPTIAVLASEYTPPPPEKYTDGYKVIISSSMRRNSRSPVTYLKSANSIENMLARQEARSAEADETFFLNEKNLLTEAAGCNIFIVSDGILKTPRYESGILPGVTRVTLFEIAMAAGIKLKEVNIKTDDLMQADEVFITNSLIEIVPVTMIDKQKAGNGKPGAITKKLTKAYKALVVKETG